MSESRARQQGKSFQVRKMVEFALARGKTLFLATENQGRRMFEIQREFPQAKIKIVEHGLIITSNMMDVK